MRVQVVAVLLSLCLLTSCHKEGKSIPAKHEPRATVRVAIAEDPHTLDPRQARDLATLSIIRLLFDGLMRMNLNDEVSTAIAEKVVESEDHIIYTFYLRHALWSNGDPVTAYDFEYAWKKVLDPQFPAPNAYQLYVIKNAKKAKQGTISIDQVGISALDNTTLQVTLEQPTPYFLKLVTMPVYFPVNKIWEQKHPAWTSEGVEKFVCNGPFCITDWKHDDQLTLAKHSLYWDQPVVNLEQIEFIKLEENTALLLFAKGELDWIGSPLSTLPPDAIPTLKQQNQMSVVPAAGTQFFRFNTLQAPFNHQKMRQAFAYAIDRQSIIDHILQGNQKPATALVPCSMHLQKEPYFQDMNIAHAQTLFNEALEEIGLSRTELPPIVLSYSTSERNQKVAQAVQQQWNKTLDIFVQLENFEGKVLIEKLANMDYQVSIGSWFADIQDPINFLEVFKSANNGTNNTGWEDPEFTRLLNASGIECEPAKRLGLLKQAETRLIQQMPIAPIFHFTFNFLKSENILNTKLSELGFIELKYASVTCPNKISQADSTAGL